MYRKKRQAQIMRFRNDGFKNVVETVGTVYCRKSEQTEESAIKSLFEELGGTYHKKGDYFLPDLSLPETTPIGIWGQRRKHYLKTQTGATLQRSASQWQLE